MLGRLLGHREDRALTYQQMWLRGDDMPSGTRAGVNINQHTAMTIGVVYAAVRLIADSISTLPLSVYIRDAGERRPFYPRPVWVDQPDPDPSVGRSDHYQALLVSLLLNGNYYGRILRDIRGDVLAISPLDPMRVEPRRNVMGFVDFVVDGSLVLPAADVIHITELRKPGALKGTSKIDELREVLGISKALDEFAARYFGSGTLSSGIISYPGDMTEEQATRLKDQFEKNSRGLRNAHRPNVLTGGAKFDKMSADAEQSQLTASREFAVVEIARAFKIPPSRLGVTTPGTRAYASVEQDAIDFNTITLLPYVAKIEEAYSRLLPSTAFLKFNMAGLERGDLQSRYAAYSVATQAGFLSVNDIHRLEDMRSVDGGDAYRVPLANVSLAAAGITDTQMRVAMYRQLIDAGVEPDAAAVAAGLPPMKHTGLPSVQLQPPTDPTTEASA